MLYSPLTFNDVKRYGYTQANEYLNLPTAGIYLINVQVGTTNRVEGIKVNDGNAQIVFANDYSNSITTILKTSGSTYLYPIIYGNDDGSVPADSRFNYIKAVKLA